MATPPDDRACFHCIHWRPETDPAVAEHLRVGECREGPPVRGQHEGLGVWPRTRAHWECGRFVQAPPAPAKPPKSQANKPKAPARKREGAARG